MYILRVTVLVYLLRSEIPIAFDTADLVNAISNISEKVLLHMNGVKIPHNLLATRKSELYLIDFLELQGSIGKHCSC